MIKMFVYTGITNTNYNTNGFYHLIKNLNASINGGLLCTTNNAGGNVSLQVSFDGVSWFEVSNFAGLAVNATKFILLGTSYLGIVGIRIAPPANQTYTLTCCEAYFAV